MQTAQLNKLRLGRRLSAASMMLRDWVTASPALGGPDVDRAWLLGVVRAGRPHRLRQDRVVKSGRY
ncbi:MAG TPA: hypothetical protein VGM19_02815, partial [Armatimonadota bacterium]